MRRAEERSLAPELSLVDCRDDLLWQRDGRVTLVYRLQALHEAGMDDEQMNAAAFIAEDVWSGLPEGTSYQFYVLVDHARGVALVEEALPEVPDTGPASRFLEEIRRARVSELRRVGALGSGQSLVQERRHFLAATFRPAALRRKAWRSRLADSARRLLAGSFTKTDRYEAAYEGVLAESSTFDKRVGVGLLQIGLGFERCRTGGLVSFVHELLNPTTAPIAPLSSLPEPSPGADLEDPGFLDQVLPPGHEERMAALIDDDLLVRREHLRVGDRFAAVITLKQLPDATEPAFLVPLLRMGREHYTVVYRVDIPPAATELAALRAKAALAAGLRLENFLVKSDRADPVAKAVQKQSDEALDRIVASTQRIFGTSLHVTLYESSPEHLEAATQETLGVMSRAHGLRGYRETYLLKPTWLSLLPGAPPLPERRRRALTPTMVDLLPIFDFRVGEGKVPFTTPHNSLVLFDPFDTRCQANANILITGTSGAGKSVLVQYLLSGYEIACLGRGEPPPFVFILDNGASYERYLELRPEDARYVSFDFEEPPGVDVFAWREEDGPVEEHVSRVEWLLLDLLRVSEDDEERFERKKAAVEEALFRMYRGEVPRTFEGLSRSLGTHPEGRDLVPGLFPFTEGKFRRLTEPRAELGLEAGVRSVCYDFKGLGEHRDLAAVALRLVIYEIRRFSARVHQRRHRTFLALDESWALLDRAGALSATAAPFIAASVRMGRKEGTSVIGLSQQIEDFARSGYGAAILGNSATKFVGLPGSEGLDGLREHLRLTDRQVDQVRRLTRTDRFHDFLLMQGTTSHVVRVPLDPLSRWVFSTAARDRERIGALAEARPDLGLLDRLRLLAAEARP